MVLDTLRVGGLEGEALVEYLLGRDGVQEDHDLLESELKCKSVLVTGAGGSIGSELCRQILQYQPKVLVALDMNEYNLYAVHQTLKDSGNIVPILSDCGNRSRMLEVLRTFRITHVYHAAAYKHVPLVESNPVVGVYNNLKGAMEVCQTANICEVERLVLISTDKAVNPTTLMGASKRLTELYAHAFAGNTQVSVVRFGNVLWSSGSVIPLFVKQLERGLPITITHPDVTRYFMSIREAVLLTLTAGCLEGGNTYVLDMGVPVHISSLARKLALLLGIPFQQEVVGLRPGEKLHEELYYGTQIIPTGRSRISKCLEDVKSHYRYSVWRVIEACQENDAEGLVSVIKEILPEYKPTIGVVDSLYLTKKHETINQKEVEALSYEGSSYRGTPG